MTSPRFHPSTELLLDYASGALERGRALVLSAHVASCAECCGQVRVAEAVGGALLAEATPAEMAPDALQRVLARIESQPTPPPGARSKGPQRPDDWIWVPDEVLLAAERRKRWAAPGVWVAQVTRDRKTGARSYLLGIGPVIAVPSHTHNGLEMVCVLKGAFKDRGHIYRPGDVAESDETIEHKPRVTREGDCVCLISADGPLRPRSWQARLLQPLVGI